jgi:phospholipase C
VGIRRVATALTIDPFSKQQATSGTPPSICASSVYLVPRTVKVPLTLSPLSLPAARLFTMHQRALFGVLALAAATTALPSSPFGPGAHRSGSDASIANLRQKIKNVVLLCMENRSVDNLLGGQTHRGIENSINNGPFCNPYNVSDPSQGFHCSEAKDYDSVTNDPSHAVTGNTMEFYGQWTPNNTLIAEGKLRPNNNGFITEQIHNYGSKTNTTELALQVMNYYTEQQVPVMTSFVKNFLTFNHWHSDVAGVREILPTPCM